MPRRDVVVMAASAGGIEALGAVLAGVPADLGAAVLVVLHIPPSGGTVLPMILDRAGPLPATAAIDGEPLRPGRVYACVADHHLLLCEDHLHVRRGPKEHGHRPAADPLFRSAARYRGPRVTGVVLSGMLYDGAAGLQAVRRQGGVAVVQTPEDAICPDMPRNALDWVDADHVVPASDIGPLLGRLASEEVEDGGPPPEGLRKEVALMEQGGASDPDHAARPSQWACPECSGVLWEIDDGDILRFRCRVGHAWAPDSLVHAQGSEVEQALWMALRSLEDKAALCRALVERAEHGGRPVSASRFRTDLGEIAGNVVVLRRLLGLTAESADG